VASGPSSTAAAAGPPVDPGAGEDALPPDAQVLTADDALLERSEQPPRPAAECAALVPAGATAACTATAELLAVVAGAADGSASVVVHRKEVDGTLVPVLEAVGAREGGDAAPPAAVVVQAAPLDGRPGDELVVAIRDGGTSGFLEVHVVSPAGEVVAHRSLDKGRAEVVDGAIRTWAAAFGPDDPNCCPSAYAAARVRALGDRWISEPDGEVAATEVPAGSLG
jgi:hypothetical protein